MVSLKNRLQISLEAIRKMAEGGLFRSGRTHVTRRVGPDCFSDCQLFQLRLERPRSVKELYDVSFVRLQPVELDGRHWAQIKAVDIRCVHELPLKRRIVCDRAANQRGSDPLQHFVLRAAYDTHE